MFKKKSQVFFFWGGGVKMEMEIDQQTKNSSFGLVALLIFFRFYSLALEIYEILRTLILISSSNSMLVCEDVKHSNDFTSNLTITVIVFWNAE